MSEVKFDTKERYNNIINEFVRKAGVTVSTWNNIVLDRIRYVCSLEDTIEDSIVRDDLGDIISQDKVYKISGGLVDNFLIRVTEYSDRQGPVHIVNKVTTITYIRV